MVALRSAYPRWGRRKLARRLHDLGEPKVPVPSAITEILRRHGRLDEGEFLTPHAMIRFERERPNELWQMEFKGHFTHDAGRCHLLTLLADPEQFIAKNKLSRTLINSLPSWLAGSKPARSKVRATLRRR